MSSTSADTPRPLDGIRVLELGQLIAGPFTGTMLGYFGAEVIKVEPPGDGDAIRQWRVVRDGTSLWWRSIARNKKCITLDLRSEQGKRIVRDLASHSDVLIENFRPGTMENWGLGPHDLKPDNPGLIYTRISGYGQTGPYASRAGYASVCEGIGGFRYLNGFPDEAPVRPNLSMGDTLAGLHAALGIVLALIQRGKTGGAAGQTVDVALYESVFNILEAVVPEYDGAGVVRQPSGSTVTGIVPTNTYRCGDHKHVIIGGNGDSIYRRLMEAVGRQDLAQDPRLAHNTGRVEHEREIDAAISAWTASLSSDQVLERLDEARVPAGPIYSVKEMMADAHFRARGMFEEVEVDGEALKIPAIVPKLDETPGRTDWAGPEVGSHNEEVYREILGYDVDEIDRLRKAGVV
jgi:crotonobetainyl-CoA:carnitine CoA-transferase CaiB-like acyl-CoA transferase